MYKKPPLIGGWRAIWAGSMAMNYKRYACNKEWLCDIWRADKM